MTPRPRNATFAIVFPPFLPWDGALPHSRSHPYMPCDCDGTAPRSTRSDAIRWSRSHRPRMTGLSGACWPREWLGLLEAETRCGGREAEVVRDGCVERASAYGAGRRAIARRY